MVQSCPFANRLLRLVESGQHRFVPHPNKWSTKTGEHRPHPSCTPYDNLSVFSVRQQPGTTTASAIRTPNETGTKLNTIIVEEYATDKLRLHPLQEKVYESINRNDDKVETPLRDCEAGSTSTEVTQ
jgi:hypothetical protein